ncbi:hypothetical protein ASD11_01350 [Aeromicrobium sp. Root495]|uniref:hypothetical protein n=1 Tax=Aeromicrobium sp. Root495 TaxID=1736550 RepID=UPI0006F45CD7|nr:hypothetical protein [Aeromicrobium sp. Root495]KQY58341.1 hypothetical protein ASD11_01350 [Aeromicrobium sp. Root495]
MSDDQRDVDPAAIEMDAVHDMLHLASIIRRAALIRPFGPSSVALHAAGVTVMLTPAEAEAAAAAVLESDWLESKLARHGAEQRLAELNEVRAEIQAARPPGYRPDLDELRANAAVAARELRDHVAATCPGDHEPKQHRDRRPPWCKACGRDWSGIQHRDVAPS